MAHQRSIIKYGITCKQDVYQKYPTVFNLLSYRLAAPRIEGSGLFEIRDDGKAIVFSRNGRKVKECQDILSQEPIQSISHEVMRTLEDALTGKTGKYYKDLYDVFPCMNERSLKIRFVDTIIERIISGLEQEKNMVLPRVKTSKNGIIALSHDVDYVSLSRRKLLSIIIQWMKKGGRLRVGEVMKAFLHVLPRIDFSRNFKRYVALEEKKNVKSTYFFLSKTFQSVTRGELELLLRAEMEIGVHGDFGTAEDETLLKEQIQVIQEGTKRAVKGIRQHYLEFIPEKTWSIQKNQGLSYDSTLGFSDAFGFRVGTCFPYLTPEKILEIPMHVMDTVLYVYPSKLKEFEEQLVLFIDMVHLTGGVLSINWHQSAFNKPGAGMLYPKLIDAGKRNEMEFLTHQGIAERVFTQLRAISSVPGEVRVTTNRVIFPKGIADVLYLDREFSE